MEPMSQESDQNQRGFAFPGIFEVTAMGASENDLPAIVPQTLEALGLTVLRKSMRIRPSAKGNFLSVSISFEAHSREDYEAAHGALRANRAIKWTL